MITARWHCDHTSQKFKLQVWFSKMFKSSEKFYTKQIVFKCVVLYHSLSVIKLKIA